MASDLDIARAASSRTDRVDCLEIGHLFSRIDANGKRHGEDNLGRSQPAFHQTPRSLVLVTSVNPTPFGEGKTVTTIGLTQALCAIGQSATCVIREPSMGPVFGIKGGAAGGGHSQVIPMEEINLHFTGDLHAVTSAHNLLSALIDNHIKQGNETQLDPTRIFWPRVLDMNDRSLRNIIIGLGGPANGLPRQDRFDITAASEVMAILVLANDYADLRTRIGQIVVGQSMSGNPVKAEQIGAAGSWRCSYAMHSYLI